MLHPLAPPPPDSAAARLLLDHFHLRDRDADPRALLAGIAAAFSRIPYENLSKIIKHAAAGSAESSRRWPLEVIRDYIDHGLGGTCFSLTAALLHVTRFAGFTAEPILADRRYGPNTHCAMLAWLDNAPHLLDPGYLIVEPIPWPVAGEVRLRTSFNELVLSARHDGALLDLTTVQRGQRKYRLTYRAAPVDSGEFLKAWDASFTWDMMRYPVLARVTGGQQLYLQGSRLQTRDLENVSRRELDSASLAAVIAREFHIDAAYVKQSLDILHRRG